VVVGSKGEWEEGDEYDNATLLTRNALQKHLQTFIDAGVKENIDILQKVEDPALLVDWVVRTAEYWEKRYAAKRAEKYDISQTSGRERPPWTICCSASAAASNFTATASPPRGRRVWAYQRAGSCRGGTEESTTDESTNS
jgi:hypothetical protein